MNLLSGMHRTNARSHGPLTVLVMAKAPEPGLVKTRLTPPLSARQAAELAAAALLDTLDAVEDMTNEAPGPVARVVALQGVLVRAVGGSQIAGRIRIRQADAAPGWLRIPQRGSTFADRLVLAHADAAGRGQILQIGMDTPQVTADLLGGAAATLNSPDVDAVLGPATDGGWWAIGLRDARMARALCDVPMSTPDTAELTLRALAADDVRVALLPVLTDVDTAADALLVAGQAPGTRFARQFRALTVAGAA